MALIVPSGGLISQVNGTVDNKVYYRGRWGNTVRTWVNPTNTITPERTAVRTLFASLISLFNSLTPDMQDDWDQFARSLVKFNRLAQPYIPTGLQIFLERNLNLAVISQGPLLLPPDDTPFEYITDIQITACTVGVLSTTGHWSSGGDAAVGPTGLVLYTTDNAPPGRINQTNRYRVTFPQAFSGVLTTSFNALWNSVWAPSTRIVGKRIFIKAVAINNESGEASAPCYVSSLVS